MMQILGGLMLLIVAVGIAVVSVEDFGWKEALWGCVVSIALTSWVVVAIVLLTGGIE
jgi:uncharacterized membrane protein